MDLTTKWHQRAACLNAYPSVDMINVGKGKTAVPLIKKYCHHCPVTAECAASALDGMAIVGVWGGVYVPVNPGSHRAKRIEELRVKAATLPAHGR